MSIFILPPRRFVDAEMPGCNVGMEGWFTLRALRRSGLCVRERSFRETRRRGPFHNLITNGGLDRYFTNNANNLYHRCIVGTGTAEPDETDAGLSNFHGAVGSDPGSTIGNGGLPDYYGWLRMVWTSDIGALGTVNLTEVAVGRATTNTDIFSRELIRDITGDPVAFPLGDDEQLEVTYELRHYHKLTDTEATVTVGGNTHDTITRPIDVSSAIELGPAPLPTSSGSRRNSELQSGLNTRVCTGDLVAVTAHVGSISGSRGGADSAGAETYVGGSYEQESWAHWNANNGVGNIRTATFNFGGGLYQVRFDPVIAKPNTHALRLWQKYAVARR